MRRLYLFLPIQFVFVGFCYAQPPQITSDLTSDPGKIKYVFTDIQNFVSLYDKLKTGSDSVQQLKTLYFNQATPGLKRFIALYGLTDSSLLKAIRQYPRLYDSARYLENFIQSNKEYFKPYFEKFKDIYPDLLFPPFYFLVGDNRGINSGSPEGVLSEVESWGKGDELMAIALLIHELAHFNQAKNVGLQKFIEIYGDKKSVLNYTIREGIAEFIARMVTGRYTQEPARKYVLEHEKELWNEFQRIKNDKETGEWMFNRPKDKSKAFDIGYVFGALIVESYYNNTADKKQAIKDILSITDYSLFLEKSGYAKKFE